MPNPNGPYPGRQLFIGRTVDGNPAFMYLVTGRSPQSRERRATPVENGIVIGPIGDQSYDPLRHYTGVKYDDGTGIAVISNGIQTEAIFEVFRLLFNVGTPPTEDFMAGLLDGARAEPDGLHTPRIAGVITGGDDVATVYIIGIVRHDIPAKVFKVRAEPGTLVGIATYQGALDNPEPFNPDSQLPQLQITGNTARELAEYLYDLSLAEYAGDDIRVCSVGGIRDNNGKWQIATVNRHLG
jgi:IMP cyclohydrolase